ALMRAKMLGGEITYLSQGEIDARNAGYSPYSNETWRAWEYWANKAGCGHMLTRPDGGQVHKHEHKKQFVTVVPAKAGPSKHWSGDTPLTLQATLGFCSTGSPLSRGRQWRGRRARIYR